MSEVFRKAQEYLRSKTLGAAGSSPLLEIDFPEFSGGEFSVNLCINSNPPLLGRKFDEAKLDLTPENVRHIFRLGHLHGYLVTRVGEEFYYLRDGEVVAVISRRFYAASEPSLFEEIGREIYGLGRRRMEIDRPVGWLRALKILFSKS